MASKTAEQANPGNTLYVSNLYEKLSIADLVDALRCMFERFGPILDVTARKTYTLRGQAFVVFESPEDAAKAMEELNGFELMARPIKIAYAKTKSDATKRKDGTYLEEEAEARRQARREAWTERVRLAQQAKEDEALRKQEKKDSKKRGAGAGRTCTILVENIPREANEGMLMLVFQRFAGLKEVRLEGETAKVEYDNEEGADAAVAGLQGFKLATDKAIRLKRID
jgi:U2 small nuclear ribonucleoprotein B''